MLGDLLGGLAREALACTGRKRDLKGIQVRRDKALRFTGHDRKARRLAGPVKSDKRGMGNFRSVAKISYESHFIDSLRRPINCVSWQEFEN
jgi:hypothetical protein